MNTLPTYPRLHPAITLLPAESGMIVDGLPQLELLKGVAAETLVAHLVPYLDGRNTVTQIIESCSDIPERFTHHVLDTINSWGMLLDGESSDIEQADPSVQNLLRYGLIYQLNESVVSPHHRLEQAQIDVRLPHSLYTPLNNSLSALFDRSHMGSVKYSQYSTAQMSFGNVATIVVGDLNSKSTWPRRPLYMDVTLLTDGNELLFRSVPCQQALGPRCCDLYYSDYLTPTAEELSTLECGSDIISSFIAAEVIDFILALKHCLSGRTARKYNLKTLDSMTHKYPSSNLCDGCTASSVKNNGRHMNQAKSTFYSTARVYNDHTRGMTKKVISENDQPIRARRRNLGQIYRSQVSLEMPSTGVVFRHNALHSILQIRQTIGVSKLSVARLSAIAALSVGIKEQSHSYSKHWAPSAGNLGATRLYIISTDLDALEGGIYTYEKTTHSLQCIRPAPVDQIVRRITRKHVRPGTAILILVAERNKLKKKYGVFSYKLGLLDGGCALAQAQAVAASLDLAHIVIESWSDSHLSKVLHLDETTEHIAAVISLEGAPSFLPRFGNRWHLSAAGMHEPKELKDLSPEDLTDLLIKESQTDVEGRCPRPAVKLSKKRSDATINLKSPSLGGLEFDRLLANRKSTRTFSSEAVSFEQASTILACMGRPDMQDWKASNILNLALNYYLLCQNVEGVRSGVYMYQSTTHQLEYIATAPHDDGVSLLYDQKECATAALAIVITSDIDSDCFALGAAGFRNILTRAGAAGHRASLAAMAQDLGAVVLAGINPEVAHELLNIDTADQTVLFACAIGHCESLI